MLPGFSIHSCLSPPPILTFSHSSYQPSPFSFLNRLCVHTCCFLLRHSSCSRALKGLFLLFVQIIDQILSEGSSLAILWGNVLSTLIHTLSRHSLSHHYAFCFKPTALSLSEFTVYSMHSSQNISFMRVRICPFCLWQSLCTSPCKLFEFPKYTLFQPPYATFRDTKDTLIFHLLYKTIMSRNIPNTVMIIY